MIWLLIILLLHPLANAPQEYNAEELLAEGLKLESENKYNEALDLWENAPRILSKRSFAIGRNYIRITTEQGFYTRFETASSLYKWGLSGKDVNENFDALQIELRILENILSKDRFEYLSQLLNHKNPSVFVELNNFWVKLDPTPATNYNERLIEHWERIAYARENFNRNDDSIIGTDDRGIAWLRYGKPDRQYKGILHLNSGSVASLIYQLDPKLIDPQKKVLINATLRLHNAPRYEIWIYERPNTDMKYNLVLMFGDRPSGGFGELDILEDLIPSRAFSASGRHENTFRGGGMSISGQKKNNTGYGGKSRPSMTPGMVMQWIYYEQVANKDLYFSDIFSHMVNSWQGDNRWGENPYFHRNSGTILEENSKVVRLRNENLSPNEFSTYEKEIPKIPLDVYQYRLLDDNNSPQIATFLESEPQSIFIKDFAANQDSMEANIPESITVAELFSYYELYHGLELKDQEGRSLSQHYMPAELVLESTNSEPSTSVFMVPFVSKNTRQHLYAELYNTHSNSKPSVKTPFPDSLRGMGRLETEQPLPLETDPNKLEMGDLILGYEIQPEQSNVMFPFVVANNKKIPIDENLVVHVEVYHLKKEADRIARFELNYELLPVNWLGWTKEQKQELNLTLNIESDQDRYSENLQIKTRQLSPGRYVLRIGASDPTTGQSVRRKVEFQIVE